MPKRKIKYLDPEVQPLAIEFLKRCKKAGYRVIITQTLRTFEEQDELYKIGRQGIPGEKPVTNARGGYSWHNFGRAFDIAFLVRTPEGRWRISWDEDLPWEEVGKIGESIGLEWGGRWKFQDKPHFQYRGGHTLAELRRKYYREQMRKIKQKIRDMIKETSRKMLQYIRE